MQWASHLKSELNVFHFQGQPQEELDRTCREDNENLKTSLEPSEEIYCENNDTAYLNRWAKARRLRQRSKEIVNRAIEDPWFSLAKEYIFEGTIRQTEKCITHQQA